MPDPRQFPDSSEAEESVVGAMLLSRGAIEDVSRILTFQDFHSPELGALYRAILVLHERGTPIDPVTVHEATGLDKAKLLSLQSQTPTSANASHYAKAIIDKATRRRLLSVSAAIEDYARTHSGAEALELSQTELERVAAPRAQVELQSISDFLGVEDPPINWLVPDVIEFGDRILLTAGEGLGKSTLLRQCAICVAAGVHPFTFDRIEGRNVLLVDLESPEPMLRRRIRPIYDAARKLNPTWDTNRLKVVSREQGVDLTKRADSLWMAEQITSSTPDLVCFGPVYKAYTGDAKDEDKAREVAAFIDKMRSEFGSAWLMETHSPHGYDGKRALRPFGSSLWLRWPEMGIGLRREDSGDAQVEYFRYPRDDRPGWPDRFKRGGQWPWVPAGGEAF